MKTDAQFWLATGNWPMQDDMERANCDRHGRGVIDHTFCGWCEEHDKPRSQCGPCFERMAETARRRARAGSVGDGEVAK